MLEAVPQPVDKKKKETQIRDNTERMLAEIQAAAPTHVVLIAAPVYKVLWKPPCRPRWQPSAKARVCPQTLTRNKCPANKYLATLAYTLSMELSKPIQKEATNHVEPICPLSLPPSHCPR